MLIFIAFSVAVSAVLAMIFFAVVAIAHAADPWFNSGSKDMPSVRVSLAGAVGSFIIGSFAAEVIKWIA